MKVIDLLNKIANGKKVPKRIIYGNEEYSFNYKDMTYYCCDHDMTDLLNSDLIGNILNDEVEIIEEDNKIKKISPYVLCDSDFTKKGNYSTKATEIIDNAFEEMCNKINEIIEVINNEYNK